MPPKSPPIPPLFKADKANFGLFDDERRQSDRELSRLGHIRVEVFEVRWGPQGVDGRILDRGRRGVGYVRGPSSLR
jgi:hypothetical protein